MGIEYRIDHTRRIVIVRGVDLVTNVDVYQYQKAMLAHPEALVFDELVDMSAARVAVLPDGPRAETIAAAAASADRIHGAGKLAIVAPQDVAYGLSRMYQQHRETNPNSTKEVAVFRTMGEALAFLGLGEVPGP